MFAHETYTLDKGFVARQLPIAAKADGKCDQYDTTGIADPSWHSRFNYLAASVSGR